MRVIEGQAAGVEGVVTGRWPTMRTGPALWVVKRADLVETSVIREDYLEALP